MKWDLAGWPATAATMLKSASSTTLSTEIDAQHRPGLLDILAHGIIVVATGYRIGLDHVSVVGFDGPQRGHARDRSLDSPAVPGKVVKLEIADDDLEVCLGHWPEDVDRRAPGRRSKGNHLGHV